MNFNHEVSKFLEELNHPLRIEIDFLRNLILDSNVQIVENIKWNGPNYTVQNQDRITMKIHPPKQIQLIFHRGAKKLEQPKEKLINDESNLLIWKENDRAFISFKNVKDIESKKAQIQIIINQWINATK